MKPQISIIMNVFNEENFIRKSIESALNQTFENFELLIVDDASTDATFEIIKEFEKDKRVRVYKNEKNLGPTKSANFLLNLSKTQFIARLDGDDVWLCSKLNKQYSFLNEEKLDLVCSHVDYIDEKDEFKHTHKTPAGCFLDWSLNFVNHIRHSTVLWKGRFLYNENFLYSLDYELWTRIRKRKRIDVFPEVTTLYRDHQNSITNTKRQEQIRLSNLISKREIEYYLKEKVSIEDVVELKNLFVSNQETKNEKFLKLKETFMQIGRNINFPIFN